MKSINRTIIYWIALILCQTIAAQNGHKDYKRDSAKVVSIAQELMTGVGAGDTALWKKYLHDDCIIMAEDGNLKTKREMLNELRPLPKGYVGTIKVTIPTVKKHNNIYVLNFIADEYLELYGQTLHTHYAETDTYRKKGNKWELLASEIYELSKDPIIQNVSIEKLKLYVGTYQLSADVQYKVFIENGKLMGQRTGRDKARLLPETETVYFIPQQRGRKIFVTDETGKISKMLDRRSGVDLVWTKIND